MNTSRNIFAVTHGPLDYAMAGQLKYTPGPDLCEDAEQYQIGGLHPVDIGDRFDAGRYEVLQKLGAGGFSTVWLAYDDYVQRCVALKVLSVKGSENARELLIQRYLRSQQIDFTEIVSILDRFFILGPNGRHLCLVLELAGPSLGSLLHENVKLRPDYTCKIASQLAKAVQKLHRADVCFGDLSSNNVLFRFKDAPNWSRNSINERFGTPYGFEMILNDGGPLPSNAPKNQYMPVDIDWTDLDTVLPEIVLSDLNEAEILAGESAPDPNSPMSAANELYAAPEWVFGVHTRHTKASDVFALGCIIFELRTHRRLFESSWFGSWHEMQTVLGPPPPWWIDIHNDQYGENYKARTLPEHECRSRSIETQLNEMGKLRTWQKMTPEQRLRHYFESYDESEREDPDNGFDIKNDMYSVSPPAKLSDEEFCDFKDLIEKMTTYLPGSRPTLEQVLEHRWFHKQYEYGDDMSATWVTRYQTGGKYHNASEWYEEYGNCPSPKVFSDGRIYDLEEACVWYDALEYQIPATPTFPIESKEDMDLDYESDEDINIIC